MANKPKRKQYGWSKTKKFPHERHPAYYRYSKKNNDDIEYLTFTHSPRVQIVDEKYKKVYVDTVPLNSNISPRERKKDPNSISYVYPDVFEGSRDALGEGTNEYNFIEADKTWVSFLFDFFALFGKKKVTYTSNSKKAKSKKK